MPNYVKNLVSVKGNEQEIARFKEFVESEDSIFDFNKIVPMPEGLDIQDGSDLDTGLAHLGYPTRWLTKEEADKRLAEESEERREEIIKLGRQGVENIKRYGCKSWYDWSIKNWGTKWDAIDADLYIEKPRELRYEFNTAWSTPEGIYLALGREFPDLVIEVYYADEDYGNNFGKIFLYSGDIMENSQLTYEGVQLPSEFAFSVCVWGYAEPKDLVGKTYDEIRQLIGWDD